MEVYGCVCLPDSEVDLDGELCGRRRDDDHHTHDHDSDHDEDYYDNQEDNLEYDVGGGFRIFFSITYETL